MTENDTTKPTVVFDESAIDFMIDVFGWTTDDDGVVVRKSDGQWVESFNGHKVTIDEVAGVVTAKDGTAAPLRDNFVDMVDYAIYKRRIGDREHA